jgi:hypothetical protein
LKRHSFQFVQVSGVLAGLCLLGLPSTAAPLFQTDSPVEAAESVYRRLPSFPLENQYLRADSKKPATNSTLVSRLIQYHTSVKGRSPLYRIDWKVTLADYLGANDYLQAENYPGSAFLKTNPMERDRQRIQALNLNQRNVLIQALVESFGGQQASINSTTPQVSSPQSTAPAQGKGREIVPPQPSGSSADLLNPAKPDRPSGEARFLRP